MIPNEIDQITEDDLHALIENSISEGKTIEYKQELPNNSDSAKKEFLADVSSFANARKRSVRDVFLPANARANASTHATPVPLSFAPGQAAIES